MKHRSRDRNGNKPTPKDNLLRTKEPVTKPPTKPKQTTPPVDRSSTRLAARPLKNPPLISPKTVTKVTRQNKNKSSKYTLKERIEYRRDQRNSYAKKKNRATHGYKNCNDVVERTLESVNNATSHLSGITNRPKITEGAISNIKAMLGSGSDDHETIDQTAQAELDKMRADYEEQKNRHLATGYTIYLRSLITKRKPVKFKTN